MAPTEGRRGSRQPPGIDHLFVQKDRINFAEIKLLAAGSTITIVQPRPPWQTFLGHPEEKPQFWEFLGIPD